MTIAPLGPVVDGYPIDFKDIHRAITELIEAENKRSIISDEDRQRIWRHFCQIGVITAP